MNRCTNCNKETTNKKFCSLKCSVSYNNTNTRVYTRTKVDRSCVNCNEKTSNVKFCSRSCNVSYNNSKRKLSNEAKSSISASLSVYWKKRKVHFTLKCKGCGSEFVVTACQKDTRKYCSKKCCARCPEFIAKCVESGKKSASIRKNRSKNEILFADLCKSSYKNVDTNVPIFNGWDADIVIHDFKVAILWNGKWHYEKITDSHSLNQVQTRDKIKLKEILASGYIPYVIKDMGRFNPDFVRREFENFANWCKSNTSLS